MCILYNSIDKPSVAIRLPMKLKKYTGPMKKAKTFGVRIALCFAIVLNLRDIGIIFHNEMKWPFCKKICAYDDLNQNG